MLPFGEQFVGRERVRGSALLRCPSASPMRPHRILLIPLAITHSTSRPSLRSALTSPPAYAGTYPGAVSYSVIHILHCALIVINKALSEIARVGWVC